MSIERNSQPAQAPERPRDVEGQPKTEPAREPPPKESVDRFRQVLQSKQEAKDEFLAARAKGGGELSGQQRAEAEAAARQAATQDAVEAGRQAAGDGSEPLPQNLMDSSEIMAMMQAQSALRDGASAPAAPAPVNTSAFADLVERHVRQLAVGGAADDGDGQVLLRMADSTLPGTDLLLSKTADGWLLRADARSRGSYDAIREAAPELVRRFAERNLGTLSIDPQFHG
ncbi:hypothetical protein QFW77_03305 [Luteimonas sp. RD2P54]|uniref:Flagellar hook-length control protein FliK n=1 Tax=Luteimonas endophytica TaxID=3042023 RepID=A0ABT6J640_9GAMM|nr:hypothetical protein [Luteimonas endophytica]MDH5822022.1 hypothetical protein [Luteimonas endophytica]